MKFYSQFGEDRWLVENVFAGINEGTFCEVGAFDGVTFSNTKVFEQLGWRGICVEANPALAAECQGNRTCPTWCCAVGEGEFASFYVNDAFPDLSGLRAPGVPSPVLLRRLDWLLERSGFQEVDLLSIDTEGTELEVWETLGQCRARVVVMEHLTGPGPSKAAEIVARLARDGYRVAHETMCNLILVKD